MNTLINYMKRIFFIHFFYKKTAGKRDFSKSRYVCAVEILETDHLKQKIKIVLASVWHWLRRKQQLRIYMHK